VLQLVSPKVRHDELMREVDARTRENVELAREINHQLGNQLQIITSALRIERRNATTATEHSILERIGSVVADLSERYRRTKLDHADELGERNIYTEK
jgi:two-component sensor histidine kinase